MGHRAGIPIMVGSVIRLELAPDLAPAVVREAIARWERCPGYGRDFPRFATEGEADAALAVRVETRMPGAAYCAYLGRGEIVLFPTVRDDSGRLHSCGALEDKLAHELGHALGLADATSDRRCRTRIMAPIPVRALAREGGESRAVDESECRAAAERWLTWSELEVFGAAAGTVAVRRSDADSIGGSP